VVGKRHFASLTVLDRAWDRLPPLVSKRTGTSAKFELWIKSKLKRALRWLTWEQVNFNAATRQTFVEVIETLAAYEQQLALRQNEVTTLQDHLTTMRAEFLTHLREMSDEIKVQREQTERQREQIERQQGELNAQRSLLFSQQSDFKERFDVLENAVKDFQSQSAAEARSRFDDLLKEFRERDERLLDEQRVCFKQLRLELSESQVLQERARRELDVRLGKLEKEKRKK
jgi:hypothetical protein